MRTARALIAAAALAAAILVPVASGGATTPKPPPAPERLLVRASEWNLILSRADIGPGPALIQLFNGGEDPHDLHIRKVKGGVTRQIPEQEPGLTGDLQMRLKKGARYTLWCSLEGHRALGMEAKLKVKRRR